MASSPPSVFEGVTQNPFGDGQVADNLQRVQLLCSDVVQKEAAAILNRVQTCIAAMDKIISGSQTWGAAMSGGADLPTLPDAQARFAIYGSNSAGKSSLLHSLLCPDDTSKFLPAGIGAVTGRICILRYARPERARVTLSYLFTKKIIGEYAIPADLSNLGRHLAPFLSRQHMEQQDSIAIWSQTLVEVHFPFDFLRVGIQFVDLPGHSSEGDDPQLIANVEYYLSNYPINGVIFLYNNPSFEGAFPAWQTLTRALQKRSKDMGLHEADLPIFMASTMLDIAVVIKDELNEEYEASSDRILAATSKTILDRHSMLLEARTKGAEGNGTFVKRTFQDSVGFGVVGASDWLTRGTSLPFIETNTPFVHSLFVRNLTRWMVHAKSSTLSRFVEALMTYSFNFNDKIKSLEADAEQEREASNTAKVFLKLFNNATQAFIAQMATHAAEKIDATLMALETERAVGEAFLNKTLSSQIFFSEQPSVNQAAKSLAAAFSLSTPRTLERGNIVQLELDVARFLADHCFDQLMMTRYKDWVQDIRNIINVAFLVTNPTNRAVSNLLDRSVSGLMDVTGLRRLAALDLNDVVYSLTFPTCLAGFGYADVLLALERYISEQIQSYLGKEVKPTNEVYSNSGFNKTRGFAVSCTRAVRSINWDKHAIAAHLQPYTDRVHLKFANALDAELEAFALWKTRLDAIHKERIPMQHALSMTQCWNMMQFLQDVSAAPVYNQINYKVTTDPKILDQSLLALNAPNPLIFPKRGYFDLVVTKLDNSSIEGLCQLLRLNQANGSDYMLYPLFIEVSKMPNENALQLTHYYLTSEVTEQAPISAKETISILYAAANTMISLHLAGVTLAKLSPSDVLMWNRQGGGRLELRVGRAGVWTSRVVQNLAPVPREKLLPIPSALRDFAASLLSSVPGSPDVKAILEAFKDRESSLAEGDKQKKAQEDHPHVQNLKAFKADLHRIFSRR